jgi:lipid A disaccharide synthetase
MIQERCEPGLLAAKLIELIESEDARELQKAAFAEVVRALTPDGARPSERAAAVVLDLVRIGKPDR